MKDWAGVTERLLCEIAFAEEREIDGLKGLPRRVGGRFDTLFTAITFAEAGEFGTARDIMGGGHGRNRNGDMGDLSHVCAGAG